MTLTPAESKSFSPEANSPPLAWRVYFFGLVGALVMLAILCLLWLTARTETSAWDKNPGIVSFRIGMLCMVMLVAGVFAVIKRRGFADRDQLVTYASSLIFVAGILLLASRVALAKINPDEMYWALADIVVLHLLFCALTPIRPRECAPPVVLLWALWVLAMLTLAPDIPMFNRIILAIISPLAFLIGGGIAAWRAARQEEELERRALRGQVKSIGGELSRARIVHDAMFPKQFDLGHIVFEYQYQPIAEIGGDYVHMHVCPTSGRIYLTLLDVAGHGLAAALTVNRLFGELERIRAENPEAQPHDVMALLNRYINLTMSRHSLFATGTCIMIDPSTGELHWVNAGHPPALVRTSDGTIRELETTCMLLGVLPSKEFDPDEHCMTIKPGDVVIAYTDGVIEARSPDGEQFGLNRLRDTARFDPPPRFWSRFITSAVANHHVGHPDDDLLVVALTLRSRTMTVPPTQNVSAEVRPDVAAASRRQ